MIPNWVSLVDVVFVLVVLLVAWGGSQKGFAQQMAQVITLVVMGIALFFVYPSIFDFLDREFRDVNEGFLIWVALACMIVVGLGVFLLVSKLLANRIKNKTSSRSDHINGFIMGFFHGILGALLGMIVLVMVGPPEVRDGFRAKSKVGQLVCNELVPRIQPRLTQAKLKINNRLLEREEAGVLE